MPLFRQAISSHRSSQSIATLFQAIAFVSWPTSLSDCLDYQSIAHLSKRLLTYPSDCLLCAVTKRLLLFGQAIARWQRQILRFSWGFDTCPLPSLYIQTHELPSLSFYRIEAHILSLPSLSQDIYIHPHIYRYIYIHIHIHTTYLYLPLYYCKGRRKEGREEEEKKEKKEEGSSSSISLSLSSFSLSIY